METIVKRISEDIARHLGHYVYLLVDPRDSRPFYVGKGRDSRALAHAADARAIDVHNTEGATRTEVDAKITQILDIQRAGAEPQIWIVRYGLTESEYTSVEASLIDVLQSFPIQPMAGSDRRLPLALTDRRDAGVTNARREAAREHGLVLLDELVAELGAPELKTTTPLVLIKLSNWQDIEEPIAGRRTRHGAGFKRQWLDPAQRDHDAATIAASASAWWVISEDRVRREGIEHAAAVYAGITRGLMRIVPDTWETVVTPKGQKRRAFQFEAIASGELFDEIVGEYGHKVPSLPAGARNPIRYWRGPAT